MWLIVGLGNPGRKYSRTRHNIGFMVVEEIAGRCNADFTRKREGYRIGKGSLEDHDVLLIEPFLYMNKSGPVVKNVLIKYNIPRDKLIVVHDDLDMETGKVRIRRTGSSGGHKGLESIIQSIGSKDFIRLKIGIGREEGMPAEEYVLWKFNRQEMQVIEESIQQAADAIEAIVSEGIDKAMNRFN